MKIYVKQLYNEKGEKINITLPSKGTEVAAGYDIIATSDPKITGNSPNLPQPGRESNLWHSIDYIEYETNLYIAPSALGFHTLIQARSSISKYNLMLANSIGLIDNDYRGMLICRFKYVWQPQDFKLIDSSPIGGIFMGSVNMEKIYKKGDKIAQLLFEPTVNVTFELVDELNQTVRGDGGFGSTTAKPLNESKGSYIPPSNFLPPSAKQSLTDLYNKVGGVPVKERYTEELKKREQ